MSNKKNSGHKPRRSFATEQESFWAGKFGDEYSVRNRGEQWVANNTAFFSKILERSGEIGSVIELGANIGLNLQALRVLFPEAALTAVEINARAVRSLRRLGGITVHHSSLLNFHPEHQYDLALVKGVLIHIQPQKLPEVYDLLYQSSARLICLAEYYNPVPVTVPYRGHSDRLFKRDFAGELLKRYPDLRLLDYGLGYHGDPKHPQDDLTWFLLEKISRAR